MKEGYFIYSEVVKVNKVPILFGLCIVWTSIPAVQGPLWQHENRAMTARPLLWMERGIA